MKLIFSFLLLFSLTCNGRAIIVLSSSPKQVNYLAMIYQYIIHDLGIDHVLITDIVIDNKIPRRPRAIIHLHINNKGEISFPIYKKELIKNIFKTILDIKKPLNIDQGADK